MLGGYWVGYKILHTWLGFSVAALNPSLMHLVNEYIYHYVGLQDVSFWAWMLGGNIVGLAVALGAYPLLYKLFKRINADAGGK